MLLFQFRPTVGLLLLLLHAPTPALSCECTEWAANYTSQICPDDATRVPVEWYEGLIPEQLDTTAYCCVWTFTRGGRSSSTDPCDHSTCESAQITISSGSSSEAKCSTPKEGEFVVQLIIGVLGGMAVCAVLLFCILIRLCRTSTSKNGGNGTKSTTNPQDIVVAVPVQGMAPQGVTMVGARMNK